MRLANSVHEARAWRIQEIAPDFRLEDVWALPAQGGSEDFATLLEVMASLDPSKGSSRVTRVLFSVRWRVGELLGWDHAPNPPSIPGRAENSLSCRLPEDLRGTATDLDLIATPFTPIYRTDVEWAGELSNRTVHAVMHLSWIAGEDGLYRGRMAVYVKPRGMLGAAYMAAIAPFRHQVVYPAMMQEIERAWNARMAQAPA